MDSQSGNYFSTKTEEVMADFYVTQERAFAPGIAGEWPQVIPKPGNKNGRLIKAEGLGELLNEMLEEAEDNGQSELANRIRKYL